MAYVVELAFGAEPERLAARPAHRELLKRWHEAGTVVTAGPFADDSGALLIIEAADEASLDRLLAEDPYYTTPGVTVVSRRAWTPVV